MAEEKFLCNKFGLGYRCCDEGAETDKRIRVNMKLGNKIEKILSADEDTFKVKLKYTDGLVGEVDLSPLFSKPKNLTAEIIKGQIFEKCYVESGALAWPNGFELCPDALRMKLKARKGKAA